MKTENAFFNVINMLPPFENTLKLVPNNIGKKATEIRIRAGKPIIVETPDERFICGTRRADLNEIYACIKYFCDYSIHSCERELSEGWITLCGGHRAGFTGTACISDNKIKTIKDISSINIRIAREHIGISDDLFNSVINRADFKGLIIAGSPLSGKTTMLRDFCRNLGNRRKTSLIDERGEIAAVYKGIPQNDIGMNTDVLNNFPDDYGIEQAIRVMSPEYVVCDESGGKSNSFIRCSVSGVKPIVSVHCRNIDEAGKNPVILSLLSTNTINYIAFLGCGKETGKLKGLWCVNDRKNLDSCNNDNNLLSNRKYFFGCYENAGNTAGKAYINA